MRVLALLVLLVVCGPVTPAWAGGWRWPLPGDPAVSRPFAAPAHRYAAGHRGADLPAAAGVPVGAAGAGVVSYAGLVAGRGVVVVVHGGLRTTYEPVSALVDVGQPVAAGAVLGTLEPGHAGCPVVACLHWGLRRGDDHLDPVRLVRPGSVRLLPLEGPAPVTGLPAAGAAGAPVDMPLAAGAPDDVVAPALGRAPAPAARGPAEGGVVAVAVAASLLASAAVGTTRARRR